jgi:uncharacterized protein (DUF885 family)
MRGKRFSLPVILSFLIIIVLLLTGCGETNSPQNSSLDNSNQNNAAVLAAGEPSAEIETILEGLDDLPLDQFFEDSFIQLSLRYPQSMVEYGIDESLGIPGDALDDLSLEYQAETAQLEAGILEILLSYDFDSLPEDQQLSYQVYQWFLEDAILLDQHAEYQYMASFMILNSIHNQTFQFFTDTHPVTTVQQAENYIARLNKLESQFDQLVDRLETQAEMGIIPPAFTTDWALYGLRSQTSVVAVNHPYYRAFQEKVLALDGLSEEEQTELFEEAKEAIENSVIPAYKALIAELEHQKTLGSEDDMGLWQFDGGEEYYELLLRHYTTTDLSADEIYDLGMQELDRIHEEMRVLFDQLGYPEDEDLQKLFDRVADDGGFIRSSESVATYEQIIAETYEVLDQAFEITPQARVIVIGGPTGGYYSRGTLDGSRPGAFYAAISGSGEPYYQMHSLTYHETIPGHHFQIELAREMDIPTFRREISVLGYIEGWALYSERLASDLGWYEDDPYSDLGRLQYEALRAARLVVDTGLHSKKWDFDQAVEFFMENVGWSRQDCEAQIARYIVLPGQATAYMVGMLQILDLRQEAMDQLGDQFDLREFHTVILDGGAIPLSMLEEKVETYIEEKLAE